MKKIKAYTEEVVKEMRKVSWPRRHELVSNTTIVLIATVIVSLLVFVADRVISTALEFIYV